MILLFQNIVYKIKFKLFNFFNSRNLILPQTVQKNRNVKIKGSKIYNKLEIGSDTLISKSLIYSQMKIGSNTQIEKVENYKESIIGNNCKLFSVVISGRLIVDDFSSLWGPNISLNTTNNEKIKIGKFCSVARNVTLQSYNHNIKKITSYFIGQNLFNEKWDNEKVSKGDIIIKNDVWIGAHSVILGGVTIGNGAVVAANSTVNKNVPDYAIVGGTPAKILGYRFSSEMIDKLLELEWWNWSNEKIIQNKFLFSGELDIEQISNIL